MSTPAACLPAAKSHGSRLAACCRYHTALSHAGLSFTPLFPFAERTGLSRLVFTLTGRVGQARPRLFSTRALESLFSPPPTAIARSSHAFSYARRDQSRQVSKKAFRLSETLRHGGPRTRAWRARTRLERRTWWWARMRRRRSEWRR
jgi:hypothetical protein